MTGPLPPVSKVVRVDYHWSQTGGSRIQARDFFQYTVALSATDAATWATAIANALKTFTTNYSNTLDSVQIELTDLTSTTAPQVVQAAAQTGGSADPPLPAGTAMVVSKHIARRYRGGHPRLYTPGHAQTELHDPRTWTAGALTGTKTVYDAMIASIISGAPMALGTVTHVNVSYYSGFTNHTYPSGRVKPIPNLRVTPVVDAIIATTVNPIVANQRRRQEQSQ
jgi:hypothetical protein